MNCFYKVSKSKKKIFCKGGEGGRGPGREEGEGARISDFFY